MPDVVRLVKCSTARKQEEEKEDERGRGIEPGSGPRSSSPAGAAGWHTHLTHCCVFLRASPTLYLVLQRFLSHFYLIVSFWRTH